MRITCSIFPPLGVAVFIVLSTFRRRHVKDLKCAQKQFLTRAGFAPRILISYIVQVAPQLRQQFGRLFLLMQYQLGVQRLCIYHTVPGRIDSRKLEVLRIIVHARLTFTNEPVLLQQFRLPFLARHQAVMHTAKKKCRRGNQIKISLPRGDGYLLIHPGLPIVVVKLSTFGNGTRN